MHTHVGLQYLAGIRLQEQNQELWTPDPEAFRLGKVGKQAILR